MGSSSSKVRQATSAARKYPSRAAPPSAAPARPPPPPLQQQPGPTVHPPPHATPVRDEAVNLDAADPSFAASLRSLGAVQPAPTRSPSSHFSPAQAYANGPIAAARGGPPVGPDPSTNPALLVLQARQRWQDVADREAGEVGRRGAEGRELMDVGTLRRVLTLRDRSGWGEERIEEYLELKRGTVKSLGRKGVVGVTEMGLD